MDGTATPAQSATASAPSAQRPPLRVGALACAAAALALLATPAIHHPQVRLLWNASASVPLGLYRIDPGATARPGDLVAVRPSPTLTRFMAARHYVEANALLIKPVAAAASATVCRIGARVSIEGRAVASALPRDRFGRPLPTWSGCRRLRPGALFLIASFRPDSFDSRYFGPVDRGSIVGRAVPLWTWP